MFNETTYTGKLWTIYYGEGVEKWLKYDGSEENAEKRARELAAEYGHARLTLNDGRTEVAEYCSERGEVKRLWYRRRA